MSYVRLCIIKKKQTSCGTRIREDKGKLSFVDIHLDFAPNATTKHKPPAQITRVEPVIDRNVCPVKITSETISIYDANGKLLCQENIIDYTRHNIR